MKQPKLVNLPNALTFVRLLLVPAFLALYRCLPEKRWVALLVFVLAALTDVLDGFLARRLGQITWFGKLFDPLADKLMTLAMLFCLARDRAIPWWILWILLLKEIYMVAGAWLLYRRNCVVKSDCFGKLATLVFVLSVCLIFPWHTVGTVRALGRILLYLSVAMSFAAMLHYTLLAVKKRGDFKP